MRFKDFLEKKGTVSYDGLKPINWSKVTNVNCWTKGLSKKKTIAVVDLGEWAWQEIKDTVQHFCLIYYSAKKPEETCFSYLDRLNIQKKTCWNIAVACLGKKEIKKRLKALEEKK